MREYECERKCEGENADAIGEKERMYIYERVY